MTYVQMQYVQGAPLGLLQRNQASVQRDFRAINAAKPHYNKAGSDTKMTSLHQEILYKHIFITLYSYQDYSSLLHYNRY